jgi:predicted MFS family arabinose efflux permease
VNPGATRLPLAGVAFLALADTAIVVLALPPILRELDTDVAGVAAVLGVYAVTLAVALPLAELVRSRLGTRQAGLAGVVLFAAGSLVCGLAKSLGLLLLARAVQATGGGALLVTAYAVLSTGRDVHLWRLAALLGTAAGPAIGGALTQGLGWRSIFLFQAPAALAAVPACLQAPGRIAEPREPAERLDGFRVAGIVALALLSGAIAAALFLTVLLLITGWGLEPLTAALAVTVLPLAALAAVRAPGRPGVRAAGGSLLVAAGTAGLAFLPTASVAWTILPQLAVGAGMGLALPALAGELLPERSGRHAAQLLSVRHLGIAFALLVLAPIAQHEIDTTLDETRLRGAAVILDAPIDPRVKLDIAPELAQSVETEDPRTGLEGVFADGRGQVDADELEAYDELTERADEVLVDGVNDGFSTAFFVGSAFALAAALLLAPEALRLRVRSGQVAVAPAALALAAAALVIAVAAVAAYALAADARRPAQVTIADPCEERDNPGSGGVTGFLQDAALVAVDRVACRAGSSREELVLAFVDDAEAERYEDSYGIDPRSALDLIETALPG